MNRLYMDEHVHWVITAALRARGVDVMTAQEDSRDGADDADVLDRASELGRVAFSMDKHFLQQATRRQRLGSSFAGVVYAHQMGVSIGRCIDDLELIALVAEDGEFANRVEHLPLKR